MRTVYLYFHRCSDRKAYFLLDPIGDYPYVKKELDIDFSNFDGHIYELFWDNNSLFFADKTEYDTYHKNFVILEELMNYSILCSEVIRKYKKLLKLELKKYRENYKIYFAKIKKKYKKHKNKLISEYFNNEMKNSSCRLLVDHINKEFNGKSPIDIEKYFKQLLCSKTQYIKILYNGFYFKKTEKSIPSIYCVKRKKYFLVDEFC